MTAQTSTAQTSTPIGYAVAMACAACRSGEAHNIATFGYDMHVLASQLRS